MTLLYRPGVSDQHWFSHVAIPCRFVAYLKTLLAAPQHLNLSNSFGLLKHATLRNRVSHEKGVGMAEVYVNRFSFSMKRSSWTGNKRASVVKTRSAKMATRRAPLTIVDSTKEKHYGIVTTHAAYT